MRTFFAVFSVLSIVLASSGAVPALAQDAQFHVPPKIFHARLNGANEVPSVQTKARGMGLFHRRDDDLRYHIIVFGLSGPITAAHFHLGSAGQNGAVQEDITASFQGNVASGTWEDLDVTQMNALVNGEIYVNVHTAAHPAGEIRSQVNP